MSGFVSSSRHQNDSRLAFMLWKFTDMTRSLLFVIGLNCVGWPSFAVVDDCDSGGPMHDILLLREQSVLLSVEGSSSKRLELNWGIPQLLQYQETSVFSSASNTAVFMFKQCLWYHMSQLSQATDFTVFYHLHALLHMLQGNFGVLGPGFGWQSFDVKIMSANK